MAEFPITVVGAVIVNKGEILLMRCPKWKNLYALPGGKVEIGETLADALKREVREETNLHIHDISFLMIQDVICPKEYYKQQHFICVGFSCRSPTMKVVLNHEGEDEVWVTPEQALRMPIVPHDKTAIKCFIKKARK